MFHFRSAVAVALVAVVQTVPAQAQQGIAGLYTADGRNPDGSSYSGTVSIAAMGENRYSVSWQVGTAYSGTGTLAGGIFMVQGDFAEPVFYVLMPDGELHGTWADGYGLERLAPAGG